MCCFVSNLKLNVKRRKCYIQFNPILYRFFAFIKLLPCLIKVFDKYYRLFKLYLLPVLLQRWQCGQVSRVKDTLQLLENTAHGNNIHIPPPGRSVKPSWESWKRRFPAVSSCADGRQQLVSLQRTLGCTEAQQSANFAKLQTFPFQNKRNTLSVVTSGERTNQRLLLVPRPPFRLHPLGVSLVIGESLWVMIGAL